MAASVYMMRYYYWRIFYFVNKFYIMEPAFAYLEQ